MTICIASVCEHKGKDIIVIATDHMIDIGIGQFEHDIRKHKRVCNRSIAMLAGSALYFNDLINGLSKKNSFFEAKKRIYNNFIELRKRIIREQLLMKFGLDKKEIKDLVKSEIQNPIIGKLIENVAKMELKTSILLAGFQNGRAKISEIQENGCLDFTDLHFNAIGSGGTQAMNTLFFQGQLKKSSLKTTIYNVYKAKRNAEVSSGVGIGTDILIFSERCCNELEEEDKKILSDIYKEEIDYGRNSLSLNNLSIFNKT